MISERNRSLVGKSWIAPSGATLFVYDEIKGSQTVPKRCIVACSICSADYELWPEIQMNRTSAKNEKLSCSCSAKVNYTMRQQILRASRKAMEIGVTLTDVKTCKTAKSSLAKTYCSNHNVTSECLITTLLERKYCCAKGSAQLAQSDRAMDNEEATRRFSALGKFSDGTYFVRRENRRFWEVHCPTCKSDEYAAIGIKSIWVACTASLFGNANPCRCAKSHYWTKEEYEKRIEMAGTKFVRWHHFTSRAHKSYFVAACDNHGERIVSVTSALVGRGCPGCAISGFNQSATGFVYCLKSEDGAFLKIGISNKPDERVSVLNKKTPFGFSLVGKVEMQGFLAMKKESELHARFMNAGFKGFDGATEWFRYDDEIISLFA